MPFVEMFCVRAGELPTNCHLLCLKVDESDCRTPSLDFAIGHIISHAPRLGPGLVLRLSSMPLTPADISTSESISGLKLSKDASRVVYSVSPISKLGKYATSALWIAETSKANSAVQITSGAFHDHSAQFNPDTSKPAEIFFLSDRHALGDADQIYRFILAPFAREPIPLTPISNKKGISSFCVSPSGRFIAFTSPDEPVEGTPGDPIVFGDKTKLGRLRLINLNTHA